MTGLAGKKTFADFPWLHTCFFIFPSVSLTFPETPKNRFSLIFHVYLNAA